MPRAGFTLIELLIAITIMALVTMICFAGLTSVLNSSEAARASAMELRQRQFLQRYFETNFSSAYYDHKEIDPAQYLIQRGRREVLFEGIDESGSEGPLDSVTFWSTAPPTGGTGLPGEIKQVVIEAVKGDEREEEEAAAAEEAAESQPDFKVNTLRIIETAWLSGSGDGSDPLDGSPAGGFLDEEDEDGQSGVWEVPIESFDVQYHDSQDWVDAWSWAEEQRMLPWAVRIRINFAKSEVMRDIEEDAGIDRKEVPDFEQVIMLRMGLGTLLSPDELAEATLNQQDAAASRFPSWPLPLQERNLAYPEMSGSGVPVDGEQPQDDTGEDTGQEDEPPDEQEPDAPAEQDDLQDGIAPDEQDDSFLEAS